MTTPFVCVLLALLLVYASKIPVALAQSRMPEKYDNQHPRAQQERLEGWGARALAGHRNAFENFPGFAIGVVVAHLGGLDEYRATLLAITFLGARVVYHVAYVANLDYLRSTAWTIGFLATCGFWLLSWV